MWRELPWQSGEIILARQQFLGGLGLFNTVAGANLNTLKSDIESAATADERLGARTVYSSSVIVCNNNASYDILLNDLKQINVRDFYYIGHSSGNAIGYSEGAPGNGITTERLRFALRNFFISNAAHWQGRRLLTMRKPFRFAFIDGCLSAQCGFYGALGILADNDHTRLGKKRRSSLGWTTSVKDSIINNNQANWSARFWKEWVDTATDDYDISLQVAANRASVAIPLPMNPLVWGYRHLTWAE